MYIIFWKSFFLSLSPSLYRAKNEKAKNEKVQKATRNSSLLLQKVPSWKPISHPIRVGSAQCAGAPPSTISSFPARTTVCSNFGTCDRQQLHSTTWRDTRTKCVEFVSTIGFPSSYNRFRFAWKNSFAYRSLLSPKSGQVRSGQLKSFVSSQVLCCDWSLKEFMISGAADNKLRIFRHTAPTPKTRWNKRTTNHLFSPAHDPIKTLGFRLNFDLTWMKTGHCFLTLD